jgi:hypothetical protein
MAGRQDAAPVRARSKQIAELDRLVAFDAGHRRFAGNIALGKRSITISLKRLS